MIFKSFKMTFFVFLSWILLFAIPASPEGLWDWCNKTLSKKLQISADRTVDVSKAQKTTDKISYEFIRNYGFEFDTRDKDNKISLLDQTGEIAFLSYSIGKNALWVHDTEVKPAYQCIGLYVPRTKVKRILT